MQIEADVTIIMRLKILVLNVEVGSESVYDSMNKVRHSSSTGIFPVFPVLEKTGHIILRLSLIRSLVNVCTYFYIIAIYGVVTSSTSSAYFDRMCIRKRLRGQNWCNVLLSRTRRIALEYKLVFESEEDSYFFPVLVLVTFSRSNVFRLKTAVWNKEEENRVKSLGKMHTRRARMILGIVKMSRV